MALHGVLLVSLAALVAGQSNYANHGNSIEYTGTGLPEQATLDGKVTKLDDLSPVIFLNRTKAALNCAAGSMEAELKFEEPFYGIAYADFNRNSACFVAGNGNLTYKIEMPLKGCGTIQVHLALNLERERFPNSAVQYAGAWICNRLVTKKNFHSRRLCICFWIAGFTSLSLCIEQVHFSILHDGGGRFSKHAIIVGYMCALLKNTIIGTCALTPSF